MEKYAKEIDHIEHDPSARRLSAQGRRISIVDDVFGEIKEDGPNYRDVSLYEYERVAQIDNVR